MITFDHLSFSSIIKCVILFCNCITSCLTMLKMFQIMFKLLICQWLEDLSNDISGELKQQQQKKVNTKNKQKTHHHLIPILELGKELQHQTIFQVCLLSCIFHTNEEITLSMHLSKWYDLVLYKHNTSTGWWSLPLPLWYDSHDILDYH